MRQSTLTFAFTLCAVAFLRTGAFAEEWRHFSDPQGRFVVDLPITSFAASQTATGHLTLTEIGGDAVIDIYTGANQKHLSPSAFAAELSNDGEIKDITYRAGGATWFVFSGHFRGRGDELPLIYYAKYLFSSDLERVAGFEISYSPSEKLRMDPVVGRLQKTFKVP